MEELNSKKLENINGGGVSPAVVLVGVSTAIIFISSVINGIVHPNKCN